MYLLSTFNDNDSLITAVSEELKNGLYHVFQISGGYIPSAEIIKQFISDLSYKIPLQEITPTDTLQTKITTMIFELEDKTNKYRFDLMGQAILFWAVNQANDEYKSSSKEWSSTIGNEDMEQLCSWIESDPATHDLPANMIKDFYPEFKQLVVNLAKSYTSFIEYNAIFMGNGSYEDTFPENLIYSDPYLLLSIFSHDNSVVSPELLNIHGEQRLSGSYLFPSEFAMKAYEQKAVLAHSVPCDTIAKFNAVLRLNSIDTSCHQIRSMLHYMQQAEVCLLYFPMTKRYGVSDRNIIIIGPDQSISESLYQLVIIMRRNYGDGIITSMFYKLFLAAYNYSK